MRFIWWLWFYQKGMISFEGVFPNYWNSLQHCPWTNLPWQDWGSFCSSSGQYSRSSVTRLRKNSLGWRKRSGFFWYSSIDGVSFLAVLSICVKLMVQKTNCNKTAMYPIIYIVESKCFYIMTFPIDRYCFTAMSHW